MKDIRHEEEKWNVNLKGEEKAQLIREKQYKLQLKNEHNLKTFFLFIFNFTFSLYSSYTFIMKKKRKLKRLTNERMELQKKLNKSNSSDIENKSRKLLNVKEVKVNSKKYKYKRLISFKNYIIILIYLNEIISVAKIVLSAYKTHIIDSKFSIITLTIKGIGNNSILSSEFNSSYYPNRIYINGEEQSIISFSYIFNQTDNDVELMWNNSIDNCRRMFQGCKNITKINLSNFDTSKVTTMQYMLNDCSNLNLLDLSNINTSNVEDMSFLFYRCNYLTSLNLSNLDTSKVTNMQKMFMDCQHLRFLNLSNLDNSNVRVMHSMLMYCFRLISIDLTNFNTQNVINMASIFYNCAALNSLDLSYFNTSNVEDMANMFHGCSSLNSLNLSNFNTPKVKNMLFMFQDCANLSSLILSHFDTSNVTNMGYMFYGCKNLISLDLSSFITSNVTYMGYMFYGCKTLSTLDLSNFITSKVNNMESMFANCLSLTSLNLSNFKTLSVTNMNEMFYCCLNLSSLDLSNFDTSNVESMGYMFYGCQALTSLNLSNFITSKVKYMNNSFSNCVNLGYIYLNNFIETQLLSAENIFNEIPDNVVICLNDNSDKILSEIIKKKCYTIDCSDSLEIKQKKLVNKTGICYNNLDYDIIYNYEYNGKYYENCINGNLINNSTIKGCKCDEEECLSCLDISENKRLCLKCNNGYYEIENDNYSIKDGYVNCYKNPIGFYLDKNESIYKKCYYSCKKCEINGDNVAHNCLKCDDNYSYSINKTNYLNCYENCTYYHYFDKDNNYHCTLNSTCPDNFSELILDKLECVNPDDINSYSSSEIMNEKSLSTLYNKEKIESELLSTSLKKEDINEILSSSTVFDKENIKTEISTTIINKEKVITTDEIEKRIKFDTIKDLMEEIIKNKTKDINKENEIEYFNTIIKTIDNFLTFENYDTSDIDDDKIVRIEKGKINFIIGTTLNLKRNTNDNRTNIDLGECELILRKFYNLTNNETLYLKLLEVKQEKMKIPKIEYDIYSKLNRTNLIKLNASICINSKIYLYIPVFTRDSFDILNSSSGYYNDICYTTISESGTDISLKDRKNEFVEKNVCQDECDFDDYNYTSQKSKCSCKFKESSFSFDDIKINKTKLLENIKNIKSITNLNILVCHERLFSKPGLSKNVGFYILIIIIISCIIYMFLFYMKQFDLLKNKIKDIVNAKKHFDSIKKNKTEEQEENEQKDEKEKNFQKEIKLDFVKNDNNIDIDIYKNKKIKRKKKTSKSFKGKSKQNKDKIINKKETVILYSLI